MRVVGWKLRARVFLERLWQPTCACMTCMTAPIDPKQTADRL